eukprot:scaffold8071_cov430-Prasinococcus_capsulatus_cf.AAC.1
MRTGRTPAHLWTPSRPQAAPLSLIEHLAARRRSALFGCVARPVRVLTTWRRWPRAARRRLAQPRADETEAPTVAMRRVDADGGEAWIDQSGSAHASAGKRANGYRQAPNHHVRFCKVTGTPMACARSDSLGLVQRSVRLSSLHGIPCEQVLWVGHRLELQRVAAWVCTPPNIELSLDSISRSC